MKNQQAPTPRSLSDGRRLLVHSIFDTVQGEGPFAGCRAVFVRLARCNLQCPMCDTEYTDGAKYRTVTDVVSDVRALRQPQERRQNLVVLTGGEPFRQNISPLCTWLQEAGYHVQIETNGVLPVQDVQRLVWLRNMGALTVVLSPKSAKVSRDAVQLAGCYKYVVEHGQVAADGLPISALGHPLPRGATVARPPAQYTGVVYVQPADSGSPQLDADNMRAAVAAVQHPQAHYDTRLCLQMHKYAGLE